MKKTNNLNILLFS